MERQLPLKRKGELRLPFHRCQMTWLPESWLSFDNPANCIEMATAERQLLERYQHRRNGPERVRNADGRLPIPLLPFQSSSSCKKLRLRQGSSASFGPMSSTSDDHRAVSSMRGGFGTWRKVPNHLAHHVCVSLCPGKANRLTRLDWGDGYLRAVRSRSPAKHHRRLERSGSGLHGPAGKRLRRWFHRGIP